MAKSPLEAMREMLDAELAQLAPQVDRPALACLFGDETGDEAASSLWQQFAELYPDAAERAAADERDNRANLLNLLEALDDVHRVEWFARFASRDNASEQDALRPLAHARLSLERLELPGVAWRAAVWRHGQLRLQALEQQSGDGSQAGARLWLSGFRQPRHAELFDELVERVEPDDAPLTALVAGGLVGDVAVERALTAADADDIVAEVRRLSTSQAGNG